MAKQELAKKTVSVTLVKSPIGFKKNQGFSPQPLEYQHYVPPGATAPDLRPTNPRFALARRIWRHLPLPVTQRLGAWLAASLLAYVAFKSRAERWR